MSEKYWNSSNSRFREELEFAEDIVLPRLRELERLLNDEYKGKYIIEIASCCHPDPYIRVTKVEKKDEV